MKYKINKGNLFTLLVVTCVVLYITLKGEFSSILQVLQNANPFWLFMALICILVYWLIEAKTLHIMLQTYDEYFSYREVLKLVVSTQFFNGITPFSTGGQPFQIYVLTQRSNLKLSSITSATIHNFIIYQTVLVIMGSFAIASRYLYNVFPNDPKGLNLIAFSGFSLNLIIIIALIIITISPSLTSKILSAIYFLISKTPLNRKLSTIKIKCNKTIEEFHKDILILMSNRTMYFKALSLNILKLLCFYTVAYFISLAVGFNAITVIQAIIASAYVMLVTSIVPLPGASGGAEMGFLVFFGSFVIGPQATAIMLLWRFITYYVGLFAGVITFYFGYKSPVV